VLPIQTEHRSRAQGKVYGACGGGKLRNFHDPVEAMMDEALKASHNGSWLTIPNSKPASMPFLDQIRLYVSGLDRESGDFRVNCSFSSWKSPKTVFQQLAIANYK